MSDFDGGAIPFDDSEAFEFDNSPVPESDYELMLVGAKTGTSAAGNPKVDWEFKVVDDPTEELNERRIWHTTPTTGRGAGLFKAVLSGFGYDATEYLSDFGGLVSPEALAGLVGEVASCRIDIETPDENTLKKYPNAKPRNRIRRFLS